MGQRIRIARENQGWSQTELAHKLGKNPSTISHYESGQKAIRSTELPKLAQILEVSVSFFFGEFASEDDMVRLLNKLDPENRKSLFDRVVFLINEQEEIKRKQRPKVQAWHLMLPPIGTEEGDVEMWIPRNKGRSIVDEMLERGWILVEDSEEV
jgi:repressor LexA